MQGVKFISKMLHDSSQDYPKSLMHDFGKCVQVAIQNKFPETAKMSQNAKKEIMRSLI
jgi:hypothetical protein